MLQSLQGLNAFQNICAAVVYFSLPLHLIQPLQFFQQLQPFHQVIYETVHPLQLLQLVQPLQI